MFAPERRRGLAAQAQVQVPSPLEGFAFSFDCLSITPQNWVFFAHVDDTLPVFAFFCKNQNLIGDS
jgi:hypothetical protein